MKKFAYKSLIAWLLLFVIMLVGCEYAAEIATEPATEPLPTVAATESSIILPTEPEETQPPTVPEGSEFQIWFIDVGQADAALIVCDGKTMLIDGGNSADSNLMYSFLQNKGLSKLDYVIGTHAHEDHIGGLSGALYYAEPETVYCATTSYSSNAFQNFANNVKKYGKSIEIPSVGTQFNLGSAICTVLAVNTTSDLNNSSIVIRIVYGSTSFLFTGDAEREVEDAMMNRGVPLQSTVLKVGHHGSYTSTGYAFLRNVMPQYAVISCGKANDYGHPHEEVLSRLKDAEVQLFRTDLQGTIMCTSDGETVTFSVSSNENADVFGKADFSAPTEPLFDGYILNTRSMKFHYADCRNAAQIGENNRQEYSGSREALIEQGYAPCANCNP